jgi:hypothetical protein
VELTPANEPKSNGAKAALIGVKECTTNGDACQDLMMSPFAQALSDLALR